MTLGSLFLTDALSLFGTENLSRTSWKIGICDWDIRATGRLSSLATAKDLGFEGVQVTYQPTGSDSLADKENRSKFMAEAKETGVSIASFCIGTLNQQPLATKPEAVGWVEDCIDAMVEMNIDQTLVPFFSNADMNERKEHQPLVVEKFKHLAPVAEKKKKILAIESYLSAEEHVKMIESIGSNAVKVYYDVRNSWNKNYDIYREMELLGKNKLISQIHFKEDRLRLGEGGIDFNKVCEIMDKIGYTGWIIVESSASGDWREAQIANLQFVKKLIGR